MRNRQLITGVTSFMLAMLVAITPWASAETQRFIDYDYDAAGNIIGVRSGVNLASPDVITITPAFINKEKISFMSATGSNLFRAEVTTITPGLTISNVLSRSSTQITFILFADATVEIGPAELTFTTRLGSDTENISIAEKTPVISTEPSPIVLAPDNQPREVKLVFEEPYETDQTYQLSTRDETFATVNEEIAVLLAGETEITISMTGLVVGSTELDITQPATFQGLGIPVIVEDSQLPAGNYAFYTRPVGVSAYVPQEVQTTGPFVSQPVGVGAYVQQEVQTNGPFVSQPVGVGVYIPQPVQTTGPFVSQPVGVGAYIQQEVQTDGPFVTQIVGTVLGTFIDQVSPQVVTRGSSTSLVIDGLELDEVSDVAFVPATGITQSGSFTVNLDGTQMTVPIDIDSGATTGTRVIVLTTPAGEQMYSNGTIIIQ